MRFDYQANSLEETKLLAAALAARLEAGTVVALDGDLGAGKTTFSQAIAAAMGVPGVVNSPTFTIIKEYEGRSLPLYHMDVYRLSLLEADELGLDDYFYGDGVTLVEWASLIEPMLPEERIAIYIETDGPAERTFRLTAYGRKYADWCAGLKENGL
ncbi:tRNA (adenosine(37)-N6)-threonylcarbamoyltransferase complex ATPase subunit type 1 TsaE [Paenibacillus contaminans]|uniref:tRNA threonylcarbamoyladenosine biosynthesis protein TsaE n=1 Tax=Paenibacillus contaminans TaxID=450362 RepID=A0A329MK13_9BACL|nr:tRNA (adenosine(37)-N6)-threonylcarbamoyltransferase complex ATPase subunit type 1 TsaE [Paenibacillus contaminans]RAV20281.1 tRNA (adenosine(37)-N6)-threonylcarbamoyltransferase complex ATPase subunit type 1 TsaE [Paenibacillus contaminans]